MAMVWVLSGMAPAQSLWEVPLPKDPSPLLVKHYFYLQDKPDKPILSQVDKYNINGLKFLTETYQDGILSEFTKYKYNPQGDEIQSTSASVSGEVTSSSKTQHFYNGEGKLTRSIREMSGQPPRETKINHQTDGGWTERVYIGGHQQYSTSYDAEGRITGEYADGIKSGAIYGRDAHGEVSYVRENHEEGHNVYHLTNKYRPDGQLESVYRDGRKEKSCTYDEEGRLTTVSFFDGNGKKIQYVAYHYSAE